MYSPKLKSIQGIILLFLLLAIPVGIYFYRTQNVGETRSKAGTPTVGNVYSPYTAAQLSNMPGGSPLQGGGGGAVHMDNSPPDPCLGLTCDPGEQKYFSDGNGRIGNPVTNESALTSKDYCKCKPAPAGQGGTLTLASSPTPTGTMSQRCNAACTGDAICGEGMVCVQTTGGGKCRNSQCYGVEDCWCYKMTSPTPTQLCNIPCTGDADCGTSMICVETPNGNKCRNPQCYGKENCICYSTLTTPTPIPPTPTEQDLYYLTPTPMRVYVPVTQDLPTPTPTISSMLLSELLATPTPIMSQLPLVTAPILTIDPFYNSKKQAQPLFTLSGTSDPNAQLTITITPDGVGSTITADSLGYWTYTLPKKLTNGNKQLTVLARSPSGGQMTKTETFKVVGGFQFPTAALVFSLILALGVGGYILYQKKMTKSTPPPTEPYTPTTTPESTSTEPPQTEESPQPPS